MKHLLIGFLISWLSACGSMITLFSSDQTVESRLQEKKTRCAHLPRVYSGVAYDFCALHAEPGYYEGPIIDVTSADYSQGKAMAVFLATDFLLSGVIDTAALPYTIYRQHGDGSIVLRK